MLPVRSRSPGPALERSSSAETRKVKMEEAMEVCIYMYCRSSDALYPQPPLLPPGAFINKDFRLLRFSSSSVVACQPSFYTCWTNDIWVFLGGGIAGFCRHIACLGFSRSFMLQDPLNVYLVANGFSTKTSLNNNVSHPLFTCGLLGSASFSFTARFLRCTKALVLSYSAPESQS